MNAGVKIVVYEEKDPRLEYANQVKNFLHSQGQASEIIKVGENFGEAVMCVPHTAASPFCVVLGGDGTMLRVAHYAAACGLPLLGINLGTLGFLTDVDKFHGQGALEKILAGNFSREKRIMLEGEFPSGEIIPLQKRLALNEVFVGVAGKLVDYSVYVNEQRLETLRADGIIISTPTGSTAYNLAAGGPILMPSGKMIVITPVCPHSLSARPWVIDATDTVRVVAKQPSQVFIDGDLRSEIPPGESVLVKQSQHSTTILRTTQVNFYATLRKKNFV